MKINDQDLILEDKNGNLRFADGIENLDEYLKEVERRDLESKEDLKANEFWRDYNKALNGDGGSDG